MKEGACSRQYGKNKKTGQIDSVAGLSGMALGLLTGLWPKSSIVIYGPGEVSSAPQDLDIKY